MKMAKISALKNSGTYQDEMFPIPGSVGNFVKDLIDQAGTY